jgi:hypothetical protein
MILYFGSYYCWREHITRNYMIRDFIKWSYMVSPLLGNSYDSIEMDTTTLQVKFYYNDEVTELDINNLVVNLNRD